MERRQTLARQWLVADTRTGDILGKARKLPSGSGILFLYCDMPRRDRALLLSKLRRIARRLRLTLVDEAAGEAARVHDIAELRRANIAGACLVFLSPVFATRSHPQWKPLPIMRAATLARLSRVPVIALGGMNARRFERIRPLGFHGWAGIDAWRVRI